MPVKIKVVVVLVLNSIETVSSNYPNPNKGGGTK